MDNNFSFCNMDIDIESVKIILQIVVDLNSSIDFDDVNI